MYRSEAGLGRSVLLGVGLLGGVAACGGGGMLLAKYLRRTEGLVRSAPVRAPEAAERSPLGTDEPKVAPPVVGSSPVPAQAAPSTQAGVPAASVPEAAQGPAAQSPGAASPAETLAEELAKDKEVGLMLHQWRAALLTNDAEEIAPYYADRVNRYFLQTHTSRAYVHDDLEKAEEHGLRLTRYEMGEVAIKHLPKDEVQVDYRATFTFSTPMRDRTGSAHTTLMLRQEDGDWKIFYEQDFRS